MAKNPSDKALKERICPAHEVSDASNRKKHEAIQAAVLASAKLVRELLPDDASSSEPLYNALEMVTRQSAAVFLRRSGKAPPAKLSNKVKAGGTFKPKVVGPAPTTLPAAPVDIAQSSAPVPPLLNGHTSDQPLSGTHV